jgi:peptidyl-prolyl cis-trans isomerase SurA
MALRSLPCGQKVYLMPMQSRAVRSMTTLALFAGLGGFAGCHKGPQQGVAATVNGKPILQSEVDKLYAAQLANNPQQQQLSPDEVQAKQLQIVQELILDQMIEQRAAKQNLTATDADVDAKVAEMKAPYTEEQFQAKLKSSNLTVDELKRDLRRSLTQNKLLNKEVDSRITITDADVSNYFNAHKAEYNLIDNQYHLAQIIVTATPSPNSGNLQNSKATSDADAKKKIQAIKNRLDAGEDFGSLAINFSENPQTASNGGDMGMLSESQLRSSPLVYDAVSKLKPGQSTDIIPFPDANDPHKIGGYAIFQLIERAAAGQRDLNDPRVQQAIRQQLHDSRSQLLKAAYFEILHDQAKVEDFLAEQVFKDTAK